eukprot:CAMPEP_0177749062 /NCGR_PEP_ID=MMETSP0484_2-20121128/32276_1 /TAXON_ID=354590 /ORGANISM="Rhodomonas lens, Strain RHODO" /LENGTH=37 /DNA_ID= /DNA_START= /DNA_END= /DNA_ORIENTATION=
MGLGLCAEAVVDEAVDEGLLVPGHLAPALPQQQPQLL